MGDEPTIKGKRKGEASREGKPFSGRKLPEKGNRKSKELKG